MPSDSVISGFQGLHLSEHIIQGSYYNADIGKANIHFPHLRESLHFSASSFLKSFHAFCSQLIAKQSLTIVDIQNSPSYERRVRRSVLAAPQGSAWYSTAQLAHFPTGQYLCKKAECSHSGLRSVKCEIKRKCLVIRVMCKLLCVFS